MSDKGRLVYSTGVGAMCPDCGWPIAGDPVYGDPAARHIFPRQALHAWRLVFIHPISGDRIRIEAPVPTDMRGFLAACRLSLDLITTHVVDLSTPLGGV